MTTDMSRVSTQASSNTCKRRLTDFDDSLQFHMCCGIRAANACTLAAGSKEKEGRKLAKKKGTMMVVFIMTTCLVGAETGTKAVPLLSAAEWPLPSPSLVVASATQHKHLLSAQEPAQHKGCTKIIIDMKNCLHQTPNHENCTNRTHNYLCM